MVTPDTGLENLKKISSEFKLFCEKQGKVSEADTRVKIIDNILIKVLGWPENAIVRESHTTSGFMDYTLSVNGKKVVVVEAKKEGIPFVFPVETTTSSLKLNGAILTEKEIAVTLTQVRGYCDDSGIRYAIATNGYAWIVFRAIREDMPWRQGNARIFPSLESITKNFTDFWNLLSHAAVSSGHLDSEFGIELRRKRQLHRVNANIVNSEAPLLRNSLHTQLNPIIAYFFEDIVHVENLEALEKCYVYRESHRIVATDINCVIEDSIPKFLPSTTEQIHQDAVSSGNFGKAVSEAFVSGTGQLFLLLGGIGSGKTTFQRRYQLTVGKQTLNEHAIWFSIDFLSAPLESDKLEDFVWKSVIEQLRIRYSDLGLETRENFKLAYKYEINVLSQSSLYNLKPGSQEYEDKLSSQLSIWQNNLDTYVPKLLSIARIAKRSTNVVLFIDNVDQLAPEYQSQIFLLAQRVTRKIGSTTIVALREESYYTASVQKIFTAYINRQFHIASPPFGNMIGKRIKYFLDLIENSKELPEEIQQIASVERKKICDFLKIVEYSIFEKNRNIARFINALCFGNMRVGLQMFSLFLTSGVTAVDKMLRIYERDGNYFVPFHEFLKSIMLDDRFYYKDSRSLILNVFDCGVEKNSSHFTSLRILKLLSSHRSEYTNEGEGFLEIAKASMLFENVFNNSEDFIRSLNRLVKKQLVETNTKSPDNIEYATHIRVTSAGWYYLKYLVKCFSYLDLIIQDIPFNDNALMKEMVQSVQSVGNKSDNDADKIPQMEERFKRVDALLDYLEKEEKEENGIFNLSNFKDSPITDLIVPNLKNQYTIEKDWIRKRIKENREKYAEEPIFQGTEADPEDEVSDEETEINPN